MSHINLIEEVSNDLLGASVLMIDPVEGLIRSPLQQICKRHVLRF